MTTWQLVGNIKGPKGDKGDTGNNILDAVPVGSVLAYSATTAPSGWLLCDGATFDPVAYPDLATLYPAHATPNLKDQFILGWGKRTIGTKGGVETVTLTTAQMPSHAHRYDHAHPASTTSSDAHTHTISVNSGFRNAAHTHDDGQGGFVVRITATSGGWVIGSSDPTPGSSMRVTYIAVTTTESANHLHAVSGTTSSDAHTHTLTPASTGAITSQSTGGGTAHENMPPFYVLVFIVKALAGASIPPDQIIVGPPGPAGPPGPPGPPGGAGGTYHYYQPSAATVWTINHGLTYYPNITVVDSTGREIYPDVQYPSATTVTLTFSASVGGEAYLS